MRSKSSIIFWISMLILLVFIATLLIYYPTPITYTGVISEYEQIDDLYKFNIGNNTLEVAFPNILRYRELVEGDTVQIKVEHNTNPLLWFMPDYIETITILERKV